MSDTILTFADYADETSDYLALPRLPRTPRHTHRRAQTYAEYLAEWHLSYRGEALPPKPSGDLPPAEAFVNCGRWIWQCVCGEALAVEPGEDLICVRCNMGGWRSVVFPSERTEIESQLLSLPGHRQNAPLREWRTVWSVDDLRTRVAKADALIGEGVEFPRALSIGGTRVWVTGEILTAANMNQYISQVMEDLAGRNGLIEFEDSISFPDGATNPFRLPRGTTGQRPANPLNAMMRYNTTLSQVEFYNGSWTPLPTDAATFSYLNSQGLIGTGSGQLSVGNHTHTLTLAAVSPVGPTALHHLPNNNFDWMQITDSGYPAEVTVTDASQVLFVGFAFRSNNLGTGQSVTGRVTRGTARTEITTSEPMTVVSDIVLVMGFDRPGTGTHTYYPELSKSINGAASIGIYPVVTSEVSF